MAKLAVQNRPARPVSMWPDLSEFFEGFPSLAGLRSTFGANLIRIEDSLNDGTYELRAELPGVDPAEDVDVTVRDGILTIKAQRSERKETNGHSEFSYGSFARSVALPAGADEEGIKASYDSGILTVTVPVVEEQAKAAEKRVPIDAAK
ncbi:Hsp20/alpha crystallin family protein [Mycolicibacterium phlei]|jgi:HSP20 family protein